MTHQAGEFIMVSKNNNKVLKLNQEIIDEIDLKLSDILEEMVEKHGSAIEEMFVATSYFANDLLDALEELNVEFTNKSIQPKIEISAAQKLINSKMN